MNHPDGPSAAPVPDLLYSDVEEHLRASLRALLEDRCDWRAVLARTESSEPYDTGLRRR